jgi:hypothetical protein
MEWPKELLEIFEDPLLDGVRPKASAPTADDRVRQKLEELKTWMALHGREPGRNGDLKEKMMWATMTKLKSINMI